MTPLVMLALILIAWVADGWGVWWGPVAAWQAAGDPAWLRRVRWSDL